MLRSFGGKKGITELYPFLTSFLRGEVHRPTSAQPPHEQKYNKFTKLCSFKLCVQKKRKEKKRIKEPCMRLWEVLPGWGGGVGNWVWFCQVHSCSRGSAACFSCSSSEKTFSSSSTPTPVEMGAFQTAGPLWNYTETRIQCLFQTTHRLTNYLFFYKFYSVLQLEFSNSARTRRYPTGTRHLG